MPSYRIGLPVGLVLAALLTACGGSRVSSAPAPLRPSADSVARLDAAYRAQTDPARSQFTAGDVAFMTGMISHHAQALVMSALIPDRTTSASIRTLGARIINAQRDEIALMQQWLRERGQPVPQPDRSGAMPMMPDMPGMNHGNMLMPGMLTPAQLEQLRQARGPAFDRLFLTFMIQHHTGAITMVDALFDSAGSAQEETVFKLASGVRVDQTTEINRMNLMIQALP